MNLNLTGKVALIAGASKGIGLAIAQGLHDEECAVALVARNDGLLREVTEKLGARASFHCADVTDSLQTDRLISEVVARWGRIDIAICNVGSGSSVPPGTECPDEWQRVMRVNFDSAMNVVSAVRPEMKRMGGGSIVCISSICGLAALGAPVTYSAAKSAMNAAVRGLARPFAKDGIRINAVAPGNILCESGTWARKLAEDATAVEKMLQSEVALARLGSPNEIADLVTFLASPRAAFITGAIYVADGGQLRG